MFNYKLLLLVGLVGVAAHFQHEGKKGGSHEGPKGPGGKHGPSGPHGGPKGGSHEGPKKGPGGPGRHGPPKSEKDGSDSSSSESKEDRPHPHPRHPGPHSPLPFHHPHPTGPSPPPPPFFNRGGHGKCGCEGLLNKILKQQDLILNLLGHKGQKEHRHHPKPHRHSPPPFRPSGPTPPPPAFDFKEIKDKNIVDFIVGTELHESITQVVKRFNSSQINTIHKECQKLKFKDVHDFHTTLAAEGPKIKNPLELITLIKTKFTSIYTIITTFTEFFSIKITEFISLLSDDSKGFFAELWAILKKYAKQAIELIEKQSVEVKSNLAKVLPGANHTCQGWIVKKAVIPFVKTGSVNFTVEVSSSKTVTHTSSSSFTVEKTYSQTQEVKKEVKQVQTQVVTQKIPLPPKESIAAKIVAEHSTVVKA